MCNKLCILILGLFLASCFQPTQPQYIEIKPPNLQRDFMTWWQYFNTYTVLSESIQTLDTSNIPIEKGDFLTALTSGKYIPIRVEDQDSLTYYKLSPISAHAHPNIQPTIQDLSKLAYKLYKMEGTPFPPFSFTDLNGISYNQENTRGRTILLKCWFIGCKPCVEEIPKLNQLVEQYQNQEDLLFISLAFDSPDMLRQFLTKKSFSYAVVPEQTNFMQESLGVSQYPTHFIIDESGIIQKVVTSYKELEHEFGRL